MAKAAMRTNKPTATKPTPKPPARPSASSSSSKAAQAAAHQGRTEEPEKPPRVAPSGPAQVPARAATPQVPVDQSAPGVSSLPAFMRGDADMGKTGMDQADLEIPRLMLIQGTHEELLGAYNELRPGHFFHPAAEWIFDEPFRAVVIHMDKRYILWRPLEDGGGILARADDAIHWSPGEGEFEVTLDKKDGGDTVKWKLAKTVQQSGLANWGTLNPNDSNSPPAATLMYNYLLAFPDHPELMPAILTFQRSGIKEGRKFNTKIKTVRTPLFGSVYEFSSRSEKNAANQGYFGISVRGAGLVDDEAQYNQYKSMHKVFSSQGLNIKDIESLQTADETDNVAGDDADRPKM